MSINYLQDYGYANEKLGGSVVSKDGWPVYIDHVSGIGEVAYRKLGAMKWQTCKLQELDLSPIKLGYVNYRDSAQYLVRMPARVYRQGVRENTCRAKENNRWMRIRLFDGGMANTAMGIYPSIDVCLDDITNDDVTGRAFSRIFAIRKQRNNLSLQYKERRVGLVNSDNGEMSLAPEFCYLQEALNEQRMGK